MRRRKFIDSIKNDHNEWINDQNEIGEHFVRKLQDLFELSNLEFPQDLENPISLVISNA